MTVCKKSQRAPGDPVRPTWQATATAQQQQAHYHPTFTNEHMSVRQNAVGARQYKYQSEGDRPPGTSHGSAPVDTGKLPSSGTHAHPLPASATGLKKRSCSTEAR